MKKTFLITLAIFSATIFQGCSTIPSSSTTMKLTSTAFENNKLIPSEYTCDGQGTIPPLQISAVPANAKSLALIVHDPDAPIAGGFTHWVMWNIPPQTPSIVTMLPAGAIEGQNGASKTGWYNPCPPSGTHHYEFKLYALDTMLQLEPTTNKTALEKAMAGHILDEAMLVGLYKKTSP